MSRLERLRRLHFLCMVSEINADPCTDEQIARAHRADRIAAAYRAERTHQTQTEPCGVCGKPGRVESGLCEVCQSSYDHMQAGDYQFWQASA